MSWLAVIMVCGIGMYLLDDKKETAYKIKTLTNK